MASRCDADGTEDFERQPASADFNGIEAKATKDTGCHRQQRSFRRIQAKQGLPHSNLRER